MKFGQAYRITIWLVVALTVGELGVTTMLGFGVTFVVGFVAIAALLPAALVLAHLRREVLGNYQQGARDRSGLPVDVPRILRSQRVVSRSFFGAMVALGAPLLAFTALFFVLFPRPPASGGTWLASIFGWSGDRVHFTDVISLRTTNAAPLSSDPAVALRFTTSDAPTALPPVMPMRFRGAVLEAFDGRSWRRSENTPELGLTGLRADRERAVRIERAPFAPAGLLVPEGTTRVTDLELRGETAMAYVAWVGDAAPGPPSAATTPRPSTLAVPATTSVRLRALAHEWTQSASTPRERSSALESRLRSTLRYDRASPSRAASDPLDDFLFVSKRGHCELFAASMALMLREVGVPSRLVSGLAGGALNAFGGFYTVKQGDAHVWVEAWVDGRWATFDPTPSQPFVATSGLLAAVDDLGDALSYRWAPSVLGYDATSQSALLSRPRALGTIGIAALALLTAYLFVRWRLGSTSSSARELQKLATRLGRGARGPEAASRRHEVTLAYEALERALVARGIVRDPSTPPLAHAERLVADEHPLGPEVLAVTQLYLDVRFGARPFEQDDRRAMNRRIALILRTA